jgi:predicted  nucleic acid-binding Zn-ribbon protein
VEQEPKVTKHTKITLTRCEQPFCGKMVISWRWLGTFKTCIDCVSEANAQAQDDLAEHGGRDPDAYRELEKEHEELQRDQIAVADEIRDVLKELDKIERHDAEAELAAELNPLYSVLFDVRDRIANILDGT